MTILDRPAPVITGRSISHRRPVARRTAARPSALRRGGGWGSGRFGYFATPVEATPVRASPLPVDATRHLDPRVWLVWMAAVILPALAARNPFPLLVLLVVVVVVRAAWSPSLASDTGWSVILRFAVIASVLSVVFNVLTAPFGDQVLVRLPGWWPLGDVVTANALVYGLLSAVAVVVIILAGTTAGLLADWPELLRSVPARFLPLAVAGSVAWAFVPRTVATLGDIRDAQRVRGIRLASARTLIPILVPLLATSLERATTMAEALESRGFGASADRSRGDRRPIGNRSQAAPVGLTAMVVGAYLLLDGSPRAGGVVTVAGVVILLVSLSGGGTDPRSRYRRRIWRRRDTTVLLTAMASLVATGWTLADDAGALRYSPYPDIALPSVSIPLILAFGLLLAPAVVAPLVPVRTTVTRVVLQPDLPNQRDPSEKEGDRRDVPALADQRRRRHPSMARPVPWASWPPVVRPGRNRKRVRSRSEAVRKALAPSTPRSGFGVPRQTGLEATRRGRSRSRLTANHCDGGDTPVKRERIPLRSVAHRSKRGAPHRTVGAERHIALPTGSRSSGV